MAKTNWRLRLQVALAIVVVAAAGFWVWRQFFQTYHLATVDPNALYRCGLRTMREFNTGVHTVERPKTIVSLLDADEQRKPPFNKEFDYARRSRLNLINIPVKLGGWPTSEDVRRFLDIAEKRERQPVLLHCAQGVRRTGMLVAAYQLSVLKWDKQRTKEAILTFGHSRRSIGDIERFIEIYDPEKREVTQQLEMSKE